MGNISIPKADKATRIALQKLSAKIFNNLTENGLLYSSEGQIKSLGEATNGQLPIGNTGNEPTLAALTGTTNQITVTNAAGSITLSTPQDIHTAATPTFAGLTVVNAITEFSTDGTMADNSDSAIPTEAALVTYVAAEIASAGGSIGGSDTYIQYNNGGVFGGDSTFILNDSTKMVTASGLTLNGTQTYGINLSGGTWSSGVFNLDTNPDIYANGAKIIGFDDTNFNILLGTGVFDNDNGQYNIGLGYQAGYYNDTTGGGFNGTRNIYIGYLSGYGNASGSTASENIGIGTGCLKIVTSGIRNVALGSSSLYNLTSGSSNFGLGYQALFDLQTGSDNIAIGSFAATNTTSGGNVSIGANSLFDNIIGNSLVAIGTNALHENLANGNTGIGYQAGYYSTTSYQNTFIGEGAGKGTTNYSQSYNTIIGGRAAYGGAYNASANTIIGSNSGYNLSSGGNNIFIGYQTGYLFTTGASNVMIGYQVGKTANGIISAATDSNLLAIGNQDPATNLPLIEGYFAAHASGPKLRINGALDSKPDEITATSEGVAASVLTINTEVTTNADADLDNVTLANGTSGQIKHIYCVVLGNAGDTWKITPATMIGGTQITFTGVGQGCTLVYADNEGWCVVANNGGTIT